MHALLLDTFKINYQMPDVALLLFLTLFFVHILTSACYNFELTIVGLSLIIFSSVAEAYDHKSMGERKKQNTTFIFFNFVTWIFFFIHLSQLTFLTFDLRHPALHFLL